jgi:sulfite reductase (NADPH) hemoprotein beta-component
MKTVDTGERRHNITNTTISLMLKSGDQPKLTRNEGLKESKPTLSGSIAGTLNDPAADHFSDDDYEFLKFHGIYQQDDRDLRKTGKKWIFMVRGRLPGGLVTAEQYLTFDRLAGDYGNNSLRITSRQGFQFHGVVKGGLRPLLGGIHKVLATTLAACGDVNRNVMAPSTPSNSALGDAVLRDARRVSDALLPQTRAYHEIWVEGVDVTPEGGAADFVDPLYGKTYLPRKFKVAFAVPPLNDTDVFTNCLGFVAVGEGDRLLGYNLLAGGGLGMSHGNAQTFPRLADVIGFFPPERLIDVAKAVLTVHRDFGDRTNRKHARLKYVLEDQGVEWFRREVEARAGFGLEPARPFSFTHQGDQFGWHEQSDGRWFLGLHVEAGRIRDHADRRLKSGLRTVIAQHGPEVRLTPSQNLLLVGLEAASRDSVTRVLAEHGVAVSDQAGPVRLASMACPALPTCGLALAESERFLPDLLGRIEGLLAEVGLAGEEVVVRMTGCPNGCVRPYMAEIGFVGKAPGRYQLYFGGSAGNTRLNRVFRDTVREAEIVDVLRPVFVRFAQERGSAERFGDWCARVLWAEGAGAAVSTSS